MSEPEHKPSPFSHDVKPIHDLKCRKEDEETNEVDILKSILRPYEYCEVKDISVKEGCAYIKYNVKEYDLIDADLDMDVFQYTKEYNGLRETLCVVLCSMIRGNDLSSGRIDIYREWKRGVVERDTKIVLDKADGYLSKGIYTYEPL